MRVRGAEVYSAHIHRQMQIFLAEIYHIFLETHMDANTTLTLANWSAICEDTKKSHRLIYETFKANVNATPWLKEHRDFVVANRHGYGNRAFHWLWKLLVDEMPEDFKFLEIGVFKGSTLSLVNLCAEKLKKPCICIGVTPLDSTDGHPESDYLMDIHTIHNAFRLNAKGNWNIIKGLSTDRDVFTKVYAFRPYDMVYIDGGHDYETVSSDLAQYAGMVRDGGYLIVDDAGTFLDLPNDICQSYTEPKFPCHGILSVSSAVQEALVGNPFFREVLNVGHVRVFKHTLSEALGIARKVPNVSLVKLRPAPPRKSL